MKVKVKWFRYRLGVAQRVGRGIALLFHVRGTRKWWVVSSTRRLHFTPGKDLVPILQEAGWAPGPVWTGGKSRTHQDSIPDRPTCSQPLYRLSYRAHKKVKVLNTNCLRYCNKQQFINRLQKRAWKVQDNKQNPAKFHRMVSFVSNKGTYFNIK